MQPRASPLPRRPGPGGRSLLLGTACLLALLLLLPPSGTGGAPSSLEAPRGTVLTSLAPHVASTPAQEYAWDNLGIVAPTEQGAGLAWTPGTGNATLFGGVDSGVLENGTYQYNITSGSWTSLATWAPTPRADFAFAADAAQGEDILFGGLTSESTLQSDNQTWLYYPGNTTWRELFPTTAPPALQDVAFAVAPYVAPYSAVLFGGWNQSCGTGSCLNSYTWGFDAATGDWTSFGSLGGNHPSGDVGASMVWDSTAHRYVLFGGCSIVCNDDLWLFDPWNLTWSVVQPSAGASPSPRGLFNLAYVPERNEILVYGGEDGAGGLGDTWAYNFTDVDWSKQSFSPDPGTRWSDASTWMDVPGNQSLLVTGGADASGELSDTWTLSATGTIYARVLSAATLLPIAGATVTAGSVSATTTPSGFTNVTFVPAGGDRLLASDPGYVSEASAFWLHPMETSPLLVFELTQEPPGNLSVRVRGDTGTPVAAAQVNVTVDGTGLTYLQSTDALGWANFTGLPADVDLTVAAWKLGYRPDQTLLTAPPRGTAFWNATIVPLPLLVVHVEAENPGGSPYPLAGADLEFNGTFGGSVTSSTGWANVTFNRSGPLAVEATARAYTDAYDNATVLPYTGTAYATLLLTAELPSEVVVFVDSAADPLGLAGASVNATFLSGSETNLTDAHGFANSSELRSGPNSFDIWCPGYVTLAATLSRVLPETTAYLNVTLVPLLLLHVQVHGELAEGSEVNLTDAEVYWNGAASGETGSGGWINYTTSQTGLVHLEATHAEYYPGWWNGTLLTTGNQFENVTLLHLPPANLSVRVWDGATDLPLAGASVNGTLPTGAFLESTSAKGYLNLTTDVGTGYVTGSAVGFYPSGASVTLHPHGTTFVNLTLTPYPELVVHVRGVNGTGVLVTLEDVLVYVNGTLSGETDTEGFLNLTDRPEGSYAVLVTDPDYYPETEDVVLNHTGPYDASFVLRVRPFSTLDLHVDDPTAGEWVQGVQVNLTETDAITTTPELLRSTLPSGWANFTDDVGQGNFTLQLSRSGYLTHTESISFTWGELPQVVVVDLTALPYAVLYLWVRDANTTYGIDGAEVTVNLDWEFYSNAYGNATDHFPEEVAIPGGAYDYTVTAKGYYPDVSGFAYPFPSLLRTNLTIYLHPAPKVPCTGGENCTTGHTGTQTRQNFSLLPFSAGPYWPFLALPPLVFLGVLFFLVSSRAGQRGSSQRTGAGRAVVGPTAATR